jgi:cell division protein FtsZ
MTMLEVDEAAHIVAQAVDTDAEIIFGASVNPNLKDHIKITIIATRYDGGYQMQKAADMISKQNYSQKPLE